MSLIYVSRFRKQECTALMQDESAFTDTFDFNPLVVVNIIICFNAKSFVKPDE
ncbi:hypothetical protein M569_12995 [Genlisea aurea]|uniref:Uncharacterized protein n=1 Tax=Genlisea aurea TaxID=192259 RepID=S8DG60_9LAMI|nr:hypothetical protein M569_12995 [Genlisea aurea]